MILKNSLVGFSLVLSLVSTSRPSQAAVGALGCVLTGAGAIASPTCGQIAGTAFLAFLGVGVIAFVGEEGNLLGQAEFYGHSSGTDPQIYFWIIFDGKSSTPTLNSDAFLKTAQSSLTTLENEEFKAFWPFVEVSFDQAKTEAQTEATRENIVTRFDQALKSALKDNLTLEQMNLLRRVTQNVIREVK